MQFTIPENAVARQRRGASATRWVRLAVPAAGLLLLPLAVLAPGTAQASSASLAVAPSTDSFASLARTRFSSKTVVNLRVPSSLPFSAAVQLRSASTLSGYRAKVSVDAGGAVVVGLTRLVAGVEATLGSAQETGVRVAPGDTIRLQGAVAGKSPVRLFVRAWKLGSSTPSWRFSVRDYDKARITTSGATRLWASLTADAPSPSVLTFSKASTANTSVTTAKRWPVKTSISVPVPVATPTPTPTPTDPGTTPTPTPTPTDPGTTPTPTPTPTVSGKPDASTTGVRPGSTLTRHDGDITVTTDGTVLSNLDIHGFVSIKAKNVTISNCIVRGGKATNYATAQITNYGYAGLLVTDTLITPEFPSVWMDGIKGNNYTLRRVHIIGNVDSAKVQGDNVTIEDSLLENTTYYASDPQQGGGPTHNDNVQIQNGQNIRITGSTIRGAQNFAILGAASKGNLNLLVKDNWLDGGHCTVKLQILNGYTETAQVTGNKFGPNRAVSSCAFTAYPAVTLTQNTNTYELTGAPVTPLIVVS